jgi:hypothetical protein
MSLRRTTYPQSSHDKLTRAVAHANESPALKAIGCFTVDPAFDSVHGSRQVVFWSASPSTSAGKAFFYFTHESTAYEFHQAIQRIKGAVLLAEATFRL